MSERALIGRFIQVARAAGDRIAIEDDFEQVSFAELWRRVESVASALEQRGLGPGARVAMLVTQSSGWLESFLGIARAGAVAVPLSHLHPEAEQSWFVQASSARAIIVSDDQRSRVSGYAGDRSVLAIEALRHCEPAALPQPRGDAPALILYTSGTTGKPKGALITHTNLGAMAELLGSAWQWSERDVLLHALPLHHLHGLGIALCVSLLAGGRTRLLARFEPERVWEEMAGASVVMGVPTMHKKLLDALDRAEPETRARWQKNASALRLITSGSAALPQSVGERWRALTGNYPLERFGMTEIGVGMTNPVDGDRVPGSCGPALPGMQIRIVDERGHDRAPGEAGEIWIKGPSVFSAYDGLEQATRDAFSEDGWFKSGDTATFLDNDYVKILGRTSVDILKSGGYKLSALEIEEVLREHPEVADVAVVGLPDETWGEVAVAAVIVRPGAELDGEALREWAKQRIAPYKVPKRVILLDELPRNPVGKVIKPELAKLLARL
jgi:malonyl-CoA/methylmalonyl-CoA synthetase